MPGGRVPCRDSEPTQPSKVVLESHPATEFDDIDRAGSLPELFEVDVPRILALVELEAALGPGSRPPRSSWERPVRRLADCLPTVRQRDSRCEPFKLGDEGGEVGESGDLALQGRAGRSSLW